MAMFDNINELVGYDQYGAEWDANFGTEGYWDATTQSGRTNWTDWARDASETDWATLAGKMGQDPADFQTQITGALGSNNPPQVYQPDLFPTARKGIGQDYISQIMGSVVPRLTDSVENYESNIDQYTGEAVAQSRGNTRDLLDNVLQSSLNSMSSRNMLNSSIAENVMGNATGEVLKNISNQNFQAGMEGAKLKVGAPDMLAQIAQLGNISESQDPSVPQQILSSTITGMQ